MLPSALGAGGVSFQSATCKGLRLSGSKHLPCLEGWGRVPQVDEAPAYLRRGTGVIAVLSAQLVYRCILLAPHGTDVSQLLLPVLGRPDGHLEGLGPLTFLTT